MQNKVILETVNEEIANLTKLSLAAKSTIAYTAYTTSIESLDRIRAVITKDK